MEGSEDFVPRLEEAIEKKRTELDAQRLPQLRESFRAMQTTFESILGILIKKGLLREDPYKYDQRISEIAVPSDDNFTESEKIDEVSYRLSMYRNQLDYLNNSYQFSVSFLDLGRLKRISALLGYISWKSLTDSSKSPTSRAFANCLGKIRLGSDSMAVGIIKDALTQMDRVLRQITSTLAEVIAYHREFYKYELRRKVFPLIVVDAAAFANKPEETLRNVKRVFSQALPGQPYFPELVQEVLAEDFAADSEARRSELLERLAVKDQKKEQVKVRAEAPLKELLMEAVRAISHTGADLTSALDVLSDNHLVISNRRLSLGERIRRWLIRSMGRGREEYVYEVEFFEGDDTIGRRETISFIPFIEAVRKKAFLFSSLANKAGGAYRKLEDSKEDQVLNFVSKQLVDLQIIHRRMNGLNTYFLTEVKREERHRLKGIKIPLTAIKNGMVKANQRKHEFVARKEEEEQMRRLGIR